jgi:hypothetical protein
MVPISQRKLCKPKGELTVTWPVDEADRIREAASEIGVKSRDFIRKAVDDAIREATFTPATYRDRCSAGREGA